MVWRVDVPTTLALQIAPAESAGHRSAETLSIRLDDTEVEPREVATPHGGRLHLVEAVPGQLLIDLTATVEPAGPAEPEDGADDPGWDAEGLAYVLQSRYCPSDALAGFAQTELGGRTPTEVGDWVFGRLAYRLGLSTPSTTAVETLGAGAGACRDFAHLVATLLRANGIPARLVAVYAPGLTPMDFHAVVEARVEGRWQLIDATRLAPRQSLVRIATGRDAAETAFATTLAGDAELLQMEVTAYTDGALPLDDHQSIVTLP